MKFAFRLVSMLGTALWLSLIVAPEQTKPARYALLVGVDEYEQTNFIPALKAAGNDAVQLGKALLEVGGYAEDDVRVLTSKSGLKPTNTQILFELEQLAKKVKRGDTVLFFFSGHGWEFEGTTYLLPANTDARSPSLLKRSAIPTSDIQGVLAKVPAENLILAYDMCRTDPTKPPPKGNDPTSDQISEKQVRDLVIVPSATGKGPKQVVTFFSCSPQQKSYEWREKGRGYFSFYFEQGIRGGAADPATGEVLIGELQRYLKVKVEMAVKQNENAAQIPFIELKGPDPIHITISWNKPTGGSAVVKNTVATLRLSVLDSSGKAVSGATATVEGKPIPLEWAVDLEDQKSKKVEVAVKAEGFKTKVLEVTLERETVTPVEVKMEAVVGAAPATTGVIDYSTLKVWRTLSGHKSSVSCLAFSPDGRTLASGSFDGTVKLWDVASGAVRRSLDADWVYSVALSPDGSSLAAGNSRGDVMIWDVKTGNLKKEFPGRSSSVWSVTFSPDGRTLASGGEDKTIKLWDVATGTRKATLTGHSDCVRDLAFSPKGQWLASGSSDATVMLWDAATWKPKKTLRGHRESVCSMAFSPDGRTLASGSTDTTVRLWNTASWEVKQTLWRHSSIIWSVAFSPDGRTLAGGSAEMVIKIWDAATGELKKTITGHTESVNSVAFAPDGRTLASGSLDETIKLWTVN